MFLINQCQIITFLILKYDIIENSRIELRGIVLPVQVGGLLGGPKGLLAPLSNYWGGGRPGPPSSYAYALVSGVAQSFGPHESFLHCVTANEKTQLNRACYMFISLLSSLLSNDLSTGFILHSLQLVLKVISVQDVLSA